MQAVPNLPTKISDFLEIYFICLHSIKFIGPLLCASKFEHEKNHQHVLLLNGLLLSHRPFTIQLAQLFQANTHTHKKNCPF